MLTRVSDEVPCLARSFGTLGPVTLWSSEAELRKAFGRPTGEGRGTSEDDGGGYGVKFLKFGAAEVTIEQRFGRVERLFTTDSGLPLAGRVSVGTPRAEVMTALGFDSAGIGDEWSYPLCEEEGSPSMSDGITLRFHAPSDGGAPRLRSIELSSYGP